MEPTIPFIGVLELMAHSCQEIAFCFARSLSLSARMLELTERCAVFFGFVS